MAVDFLIMDIVVPCEQILVYKTKHLFDVLFDCFGDEKGM